MSILVEIANIFHVTLDDLIRSGEPTVGEAAILSTAVQNKPTAIAQSITIQRVRKILAGERDVPIYE